MTERNTRQKETVRRVFMEMREHPTAETVVAAVRAADPTIGRATVYRVLASMARSGDILRVEVADGADRFDFTLTPHSHVKCEICGAVGDVFTRKSDNAISHVVSCDGYRLNRRTVLYYGVCPKCSQESESVEK